MTEQRKLFDFELEMDAPENAKKKKDSEVVIHETLPELLKERNTTAAEVSKATGIAESVLSEWINRRSIPKVGTNLYKLAQHLNTTSDFLIYGLGDSEPYYGKFGLVESDETN